mgnify:FL=1
MIKLNDIVTLTDDFDDKRTAGYIGKVVEIDDDGDDTNYKIRRYYPSTGKMSTKSKGVFVPSDYVAPYFAVGDIAERDDGNFVKIINNDDPLTLVARRYYPSSGKMSAKDKGHEYSPTELTKVDVMPDCDKCEDAPDFNKTAGKIALLAALLSLLDD